MIPPGEVARLAHRARVSDKTIEADYVLTWTLLALANLSLRNTLAFKGGTALKKMYVPDYRFSEDLDFTVLEKISNADLLVEFEKLFVWLRREVNLTVAVRRLEIHVTGNPALYLNYIGPLQGNLESRFFKVDFTHNEQIVFPLSELPVKSPYSDCQQRLETLCVYSPEEILVEKLCALLGRTEPRDLYDIHYIFEHDLADIETVSYKIGDKMALKGLQQTALRDVLARKHHALERLWELRLQGQMPELPSLETVIRETERHLRRYGLI